MPYIITGKAVDYDRARRKAIKTLFRFMYAEHPNYSHLQLNDSVGNLATQARILWAKLRCWTCTEPNGFNAWFKEKGLNRRQVRRAIDLLRTKNPFHLTKEAP